MGINAVLQGDHRRVGADHRLDRLACAFDIPQFDAEQHDIDRADLGGVVGRLGRHQMGSPRPPWIFRPWLCIAARFAPRAMKVTSAPAWASAAPNPPPTPPAPTTAIRMDLS